MTRTAQAEADSMLRRTLGERRIALVAWRLLVLRNAHPAVGAGVAQLSTYRSHPWRRIEHTVDSGRRLFFSDQEALQREIERLERSDRRISGVDDQGRPYTALDPAVRAMFHAADADHSGQLCADEYRTLFGGTRVHPAELHHGFRQLDTDGDGWITEEECVGGFTEFFTARTGSVAGAQLLGRP
ncbi:oxygenase MpaB family protein [Kitasatospora sp. CB01950]|uniref:oxygenase MpaB family protein n=1 Tax=Kitasatospora sp. CB01950 TaxID=1703930 RepID=UPI00093F53FB|nr:oxygenase MpaB family protein [Kitasatospora sp. CB01950]OKJ03276.1 hypothetical protein AMK19_26620 [Kitasatospora sp. CB01950]